MWFVDKFSSNSMLTQIRLSDSKNIKSSFIYELSDDDSIGFFDNIYFIGSTLDTYAPLESALVHDSERIKSLPIYKDIIQMQSNILSNINHCKFTRVNTHLKCEDSSLDSFIGRKAHIEFIDNLFLEKMLMWKYTETF